MVFPGNTPLRERRLHPRSERDLDLAPLVLVRERQDRGVARLGGAAPRDAQRLTQVLLNLVGNAIKFTDEGEVAIQVTTADGEFIVSVSDTGPGIALEDQQTIFDEFQQADTSSTRNQGGTGLGLTISKRLVELHGGRIWVESSLDKGATFWCTIPIRVDRQRNRV